MDQVSLERHCTVGTDVASENDSLKGESEGVNHMETRNGSRECDPNSTEDSENHLDTDSTPEYESTYRRDQAKSDTHSDETMFLLRMDLVSTLVSEFDPDGSPEPELSASVAEASQHHEGLPTCKLGPDQINATVPEMVGWVKKLLAQKFEKFTCMDEIT